MRELFMSKKRIKILTHLIPLFKAKRRDSILEFSVRGKKEHNWLHFYLNAVEYSQALIRHREFLLSYTHSLSYGHNIARHLFSCVNLFSRKTFPLNIIYEHRYIFL